MLKKIVLHTLFQNIKANFNNLFIIPIITYDKLILLSFKRYKTKKIKY